ncbi:MAG TPA: hypothetical protein VLJ59_20010 [Mycobacteriales bacterium]|nr:hypothetical protein [Mycobacteriales bacterium]
MITKELNVVPSTGAADLAISLPADFERDGMRLSGAGFPACAGGLMAAVLRGRHGTAAGSDWATAVIAGTRIQVAVRRRVQADDAYVPGTPPRGAPV